jgi:hypothetical protein
MNTTIKKPKKAKRTKKTRSDINSDFKTIWFEDQFICAELQDGRVIKVPISWYPPLANATLDQRNNWEMIAGGYGAHWPEIDVYLSPQSMLVFE